MPIEFENEQGAADALAGQILRQSPGTYVLGSKIVGTEIVGEKNILKLDNGLEIVFYGNFKIGRGEEPDDVIDGDVIEEEDRPQIEGR